MRLSSKTLFISAFLILILATSIWLFRKDKLDAWDQKTDSSRTEPVSAPKSVMAESKRKFLSSIREPRVIQAPLTSGPSEDKESSFKSCEDLYLQIAAVDLEEFLEEGQKLEVLPSSNRKQCAKNFPQFDQILSSYEQTCTEEILGQNSEHLRHNRKNCYGTLVLLRSLYEERKDMKLGPGDYQEAGPLVIRIIAKMIDNKEGILDFVERLEDLDPEAATELVNMVKLERYFEHLGSKPNTPLDPRLSSWVQKLNEKSLDQSLTKSEKKIMTTLQLAKAEKNQSMERYIRSFVEEDPSSADSAYYRSWLCYQKLMLECARREIDLAISKDPTALNYLETKAVLEDLMSKKNLKKNDYPKIYSFGFDIDLVSSIP